MKRALIGVGLFFAWAIVATCQTNENPVLVTMCDLYKNPNAYAGRIVEFRATAMGHKIKHLWLDDYAPPQGCDAYMQVVAVVPRKNFDGHIVLLRVPDIVARYVPHR